MKTKIISPVLFLVLFFITHQFYSQKDTIYFVNETKVLARDIKIEQSEIFFYKIDSLADTQTTVEKREVRFIAYASGKLEIYSLKNIGIPKDYSMFTKGAQDAKLNYTHMGGAIGTGFTSFLTGGILGLIPAIACSATTPKMVNLDIPRNAPANNKDYLLGYVSKAKKIKQKRVWAGYFIGTAAAILAVSALSK